MEEDMSQNGDTLVVTTQCLTELALVCEAAHIDLSEQVCSAIWTRAMDLANQFDLDEKIGDLEDAYNRWKSHFDFIRLEQALKDVPKHKLA